MCCDVYSRDVATLEKSCLLVLSTLSDDFIRNTNFRSKMDTLYIDVIIAYLYFNFY